MDTQAVDLEARFFIAFSLEGTLADTVSHASRSAPLDFQANQRKAFGYLCEDGIAIRQA
jgi:hypothetical protein